jgi:hypothetical protein
VIAALAPWGRGALPRMNRFERLTIPILMLTTGGVPAATGKYIWLRTQSEINGNMWTAVAEINVYGP